MTGTRRKFTFLLCGMVVLGLLYGCGDDGVLADQQPDPAKLQGLQQQYQALLQRAPSGVDEKLDAFRVEQALAEARQRMDGSLAGYDNAIAVARIELNGLRLRLASLERQAAIARAAQRPGQTQVDQQAKLLELQVRDRLAKASQQAERTAQARLSKKLDAKLLHQSNRTLNEPTAVGRAEAGATGEQTDAGQVDAKQAAAEQAAAEQAAAEQAAAKQAAAEQAAAKQAAAKQAAAKQAAAKQAAAEQAAAEQAAAEQAAAEQAAAEQAAAEQAAAEQAAMPPDQAIDQAQQDLDQMPLPSASQIARLGVDLTPMGSPKSGNADGTIPAWTGGITKPPASYVPGHGHPDPYAKDKILFVITPDNYTRYADQLTVGQIAMFKRYATFRMPIYPTRRSASFPPHIYAMTKRNAATGRLTADGEGVLNVAEGFPFPFPTSAYQLIWNHKLKYKTWSVRRHNNQIAPTVSGAYSVTRIREEFLGPYYVRGNTLVDIDNILGYFFQIVEGPARLAGNILLVNETLNQVDQLRQAWIYNPGQRRVRRAPNVAYDNPATASDGLATNDMTDMFNGALDRYNWFLKGKREIYVPYNAYQLDSNDVTYDQLIRPGHINPELTRYELHRVWVVEALLKEGMRHINPRRTFYLDEDSYQILLLDHYDSAGKLWRHAEGHAINYYDQPLLWTTMEVTHDLNSGRYIVTGVDNRETNYEFKVPMEKSSFTPQALRKRGRR